MIMIIIIIHPYFSSLSLFSTQFLPSHSLCYQSIPPPFLSRREWASHGYQPNMTYKGSLDTSPSIKAKPGNPILGKMSP